jgi:hypothetical protein
MLRVMRTAVFYRLISLLLALVGDALRFLVLGTHSQATLKAENLFLRKQLALYLEREVKPRRATDATRLSMVLLSRLFTWQHALVSVKPETFLGWHRKGFRLLWRWKSRPRGRPRLPEEIQELIQRMARENPLWGKSALRLNCFSNWVSRYRLGPSGGICLWTPDRGGGFLRSAG